MHDGGAASVLGRGLSAADLEQRLEYRRAMEDRLLVIMNAFMAAGDEIEPAITDALAECAQFAAADMGHIMRASEQGKLELRSGAKL